MRNSELRVCVALIPNSSFRIGDGPSAAGAASPQQAGATEEGFRACGRGQRSAAGLAAFRSPLDSSGALFWSEWVLCRRRPLCHCAASPQQAGATERFRACGRDQRSAAGLAAFRSPLDSSGLHSFGMFGYFAGDGPSVAGATSPQQAGATEEGFRACGRGQRSAAGLAAFRLPLDSSGLHPFGVFGSVLFSNLCRPSLLGRCPKGEGAVHTFPELPKEGAAEGPGRSESPGRACRRETLCRIHNLKKISTKQIVYR